MRVLQVVGRFAPGHCGVAHYADRLCRELARVGVTATVACGSSSPAPERLALVVRGFPESPRGLVELVRAAWAWNADWLHLQFAPGTFDRQRIVTLLPFVKRLVPGAPRVATTLHEYGGWPIEAPTGLRPIVARAVRIAERHGWLDRESLALLSLSDLPIVTNPDHATTIWTRSEVLGRRITVVPIGANVATSDGGDPTRDEARRWLGMRERCLALIYFGFVHPVKGVETLIRAMRLVRARLPNVVLWIVGGIESLALRGAEAAGYERAVRALLVAEGVADVVELTGYRPDAEVAQRLAAADLAVLPFNHGATLKSGTLITCLSHGLPTIATLGGSLGPLRHGEHVWLVPPRDPAALAMAIVSLATDSEQRRRLAASALEAASHFSWEAIAEQHKQLYQRV
jgi:glycosyltransferase involved in cell wall biosynthesis